MKHKAAGSGRYASRDESRAREAVGHLASGLIGMFWYAFATHAACLDVWTQWLQRKVNMPYAMIHRRRVKIYYTLMLRWRTQTLNWALAALSYEGGIYRHHTAQRNMIDGNLNACGCVGCLAKIALMNHSEGIRTIMVPCVWRWANSGIKGNISFSSTTRYPNRFQTTTNKIARFYHRRREY